MSTDSKCRDCRELLPGLLAEAHSAGPERQEALDHVAECSECKAEWEELRSTWDLMDEWVAPEPSAYFDTRLHARLRELQATAPESFWQRMFSFVRFSTGGRLRPALAGVLAFIVLLGGTAATVLTRHSANSSASPTVNDLRIYDNNAQALQEMDMLDDAGADQGPAASPQT